MRSLLRPALAVGILLLAVPMQGALGSPGEELVACRSLTDGQSPITIRSDRWVRIGAPKFDAGEGPAKVTAFTSTPYKSDAIFVTNGTAVKLSADGGCTWNSIYPANGLVSPSEAAYKPDVFTNLTAPSDDTLWAASYDDVGGVPHPHVYVGANVGTGKGSPAFSRIDVGMPQYGRPVDLIATSMPDREAYLLVDELPDPDSGAALRPTRTLYTTYTPNEPPQAATVGAAWRQVEAPSGFGRIEGMARQSGRAIWIWGGNKVAYGTSIGRTEASWRTATAAGTVLRVDIDAADRALVISKSSQGVAMEVADTKAKLKPYGGMPVEPSAFAPGQEPDTLVASGREGTWGFDNRLQRWVNITPRGVAPFTHLEMASGTGGRLVLGLNDDALYRWDTYRGETFIEPPPPPRGNGDPNNPLGPRSHLKSAVLSPRSQIITVEPGKVRDVPVTFRVPPAPQPLDVYFLMDTTASMSSAIQGLQRSVNTIAREIRAKLGVTACFGVGDVKDVGTASTYIFKTHLPVSPCDTSAGLVKVNAAVAKLSQSGGGDTPEAQTIALSQAATGLGQTYLPIPPGEGARFRADAYKVIVLISDANAHEGEGYPSVEETAKTLNVQDIKVISLAVNNGKGTVGDAKAMMSRLARATDSMAPAAGVDCDNDGEMHYGDLSPGAPLICEVNVRGSAASGDNVGPAILGLLIAVKDPGTIAVDVRDDFDVVLQPVRGLTSAIRDLKTENGLKFTMSLRCSPAQDGMDLPVDLTPTVRSRSVGLDGRVLVRCRSKALPLVVVPPKPAEPQPPLAPRPPVAIVAAVLPAPINPPAQPISNINPNAGVSHQEEQQMQLATVTQDLNEEQQEEVAELAMSAVAERRHQTQDVWLALTGVTAVTGYALGFRRRTQLRQQVRRVPI